MALRPVELSLEDVSAGLKLSSEAGWNQTTGDWAIFIRYGTVFGLRDGDTLVATSAILPYSGFGFVSMVLVTPAWRNRGLATQLMEQAIAALHARGLVPVLDATPAGAIVYRRMGFQAIFDVGRWERAVAPPQREQAHGQATRPAGRERLDCIADMDAEAFGSGRRFLLEEFMRRPDTRVFLGERGFAMARKGHRATQLGPLAAANEAVGRDLLATTLATLQGPIFLDVAERFAELRSWLEANGFFRQRPFQRMALGRVDAFGDPARQMVTAGPEFG